MAKYPIFLELAGRRVVIIGGGAVAARKAQAFLAAGARLVIVGERIDEPLRSICKGTSAELIESKYSKDYLVGAALAIAATSNSHLNSQIYRDCQSLEILCNVVDQPQLCDFFTPAIVKRGDLQIAVCTEGDCPAYAGHIRRKLEEIFTDEHGQFLAELEALRTHLSEKISDPDVRKTILGRLVDDESFEYFRTHGPAAWRRRAESIATEHKTARQ